MPEVIAGNGLADFESLSVALRTEATRYEPVTGGLARTWKPRKTQSPVIAVVRSMARVWYWLQMTFYAEMADDLLLVGRRAGRCGEAAFGVASDDS